MNDKESPKTPKPDGSQPDAADIERAALNRVNGGRASRKEVEAMKLNPAFDSWLEGKLNKIFDTASTEPLPADLMRLLDKVDQADAANQASKNTKD